MKTTSRHDHPERQCLGNEEEKGNQERPNKSAGKSYSLETVEQAVEKPVCLI